MFAGSTSDIAIGSVVEALPKALLRAAQGHLGAARASVTSLTVPRSPVRVPAASHTGRRSELNARMRSSGSSTRNSPVMSSSGRVAMTARIRSRSSGCTRERKTTRR